MGLAFIPEKNMKACFLVWVPKGNNGTDFCMYNVSEKYVQRAGEVIQVKLGEVMRGRRKKGGVNGRHVPED